MTPNNDTTYLFPNKGIPCTQSNKTYFQDTQATTDLRSILIDSIGNRN